MPPERAHRIGRACENCNRRKVRSHDCRILLKKHELTLHRFVASQGMGKLGVRDVLKMELNVCTQPSHALLDARF